MNRASLLQVVAESIVIKRDTERGVVGRRKSQKTDLSTEMEMQLELKTMEMEQKRLEMEMDIRRMELEAKRMDMENEQRNKDSVMNKGIQTECLRYEITEGARIARP